MRNCGASRVFKKLILFNIEAFENPSIAEPLQVGMFVVKIFECRTATYDYYVVLTLAAD